MSRPLYLSLLSAGRLTGFGVGDFELFGMIFGSVVLASLGEALDDIMILSLHGQAQYDKYRSVENQAPDASM